MEPYLAARLLRARRGVPTGSASAVGYPYSNARGEPFRRCQHQFVLGVKPIDAETRLRAFGARSGDP